MGIDHSIKQKNFLEPVYTSVEYDALLAVDKAWERFCEATPQTITDAKSAIQLPEWGSLLAAASSAAAVLNQRGRMSEEHEE